MRSFLFVLTGLSVSGLGSHLAGFALGVWMLQETESIGMFAFVLFATVLPTAAVAPGAGALADLWGRRATILLGLTGACGCSIALAALSWLGVLGAGTALALVALTSASATLVLPAFEAMIVGLVGPHQLTRANGLHQLGLGLGGLLAPAVAGFLLPWIGLPGIYLIDVGTFVVALALVAFARLPAEASGTEDPIEEGRATEVERWTERLTAGWTFVRARPGLVALLGVAALSQVSVGVVEVLFTPLVLSFSGPEVLGLVHSAGGLGFFIGGAIATSLPGPTRLIRPILAGIALQGAVLFIAVVQPSAVMAGLGAFGFLLMLAFVVVYGRTLWQREVPQELQGRVFALRIFFGQLGYALALPASGWLGDAVFEPVMSAEGSLAPLLGPLLGTGPGRGVALLLVCLGVLNLAVALAGRLYRPLYAMERT